MVAINSSNENCSASDLLPSNTCLIVEDEVLIAEELTDALYDHGIKCLIASTVVQARAILLTHPEICFVVSDFHLKTEKTTGLKVIEDLRATVPDRELECVIVSGDPGTLIDCASADTVSFLPKMALPEGLIKLFNDYREGTDTGSAPQPEPVRMQRTEPDQLERRDESPSVEGQSSAARLLQLNFQMDRVISAASIMRVRTEGMGTPDVHNLAQYIIEQSVMAKSLLAETEAAAQGSQAGEAIRHGDAQDNPTQGNPS